MSSIKPPGPKGPALPGAGELGSRRPDAAGELGSRRPDAAGDVGARRSLDAPALERSGGFAEALERGAPTANTSASSAAEGARSVALSPHDAVNTLVAEALASPQARLLDPPARAALEQHLRATLADDPNLQQLVKDLERAT